MFVVITRNNCRFCDLTKELLDKSNHGYVEYNIESDSSKWLLELILASGRTTVPQIWNSRGSYVGGYTALRRLINEGPV